ncbi:MAG: hypothetical protein LWW94_04120 [Candidatus Desulfofervidaceae bacterium]|nr:hypothetical protein [Candidatus Desulfofervidaceae bacterium]
MKVFEVGKGDLKVKVYEPETEEEVKTLAARDNIEPFSLGFSDTRLEGMEPKNRI